MWRGQRTDLDDSISADKSSAHSDEYVNIDQLDQAGQHGWSAVARLSHIQGRDAWRRDASGIGWTADIRLPKFRALEHQDPLLQSGRLQRRWLWYRLHRGQLKAAS